MDGSSEGEEIDSFTLPQRGVRQQLLYERALRLKQLCDHFLRTTLLSATVEEDWSSTSAWDPIQSFLLQHYPGIESPYLISEDQRRAWLAGLEEVDVPLAELAINIALLAAFIHTLIADHSSQDVDLQASQDLEACANSVAQGVEPFGLSKNRDVVIGVVIGLRTQALLLADAERQKDRLEALFGAKAVFPPSCTNLCRTLSKLRSVDVSSTPLERFRTTFPYSRVLEQGFELARDIYTRILKSDIGTTQSPFPPTFAPLDYAGAAAQAGNKDDQIEVLLSAGDQMTMAPDAMPWRPQQSLPVSSEGAHRGLFSLDEGMLASLLGSVERHRTLGSTDHLQLANITADIAIDPAIAMNYGDSDALAGRGVAHLRFGPYAMRVATERPFSLSRTDLFDPRPVERVAFDSLAIYAATAAKNKAERAAKRPRTNQWMASDTSGQGELGPSQAAVKPRVRRVRPGVDDGTSPARIPWSKEEEDLLRDELKIHYAQTECWSTIIKRHGPTGTESRILKHRNNVALKDKARNIRMQYERRDEDIPEWLSAVSGLRKRSLHVRHRAEADTSTIPRPLSIKEQLAIKRRAEVEGMVPV